MNRLDSEDEMDGGDSDHNIFNEAFRAASSVSAAECVGSGSASDDEALAAEYLCVIGDRIQAEYGNQLDALMNELDWTLARDVLLADARRVLGRLLSRVTDVWTQVNSLILHILNTGFWLECPMPIALRSIPLMRSI